MRVSTIMVAALAVASVPASLHAAPIISDDFESYADTDALRAVWTGGPATLDTAFGNPAKSAAYPLTTVSTPVNARAFATVNPTDTNPLVFTADIYDDGANVTTPEDNDGEKRMSVGIRAGSNNLVEMGMYNAGVQYVFRLVLFQTSDAITSGGQASYGKFNLGTDSEGKDRNRPTQGFHRYSASIGGTTSTFTLDLFSDGVIDATETVTATPRAAGFNDVRFGGISGLSSAGGGANFDNISLSVVPEPTSLAALGLGVSLLRRRRIM